MISLSDSFSFLFWCMNNLSTFYFLFCCVKNLQYFYSFLFQYNLQSAVQLCLVHSQLVCPPVLLISESGCKRSRNIFFFRSPTLFLPKYISPRKTPQREKPFLQCYTINIKDKNEQFPHAENTNAVDTRKGYTGTVNTVHQQL